jgi:ribosomal protein RSM22 (predicted rRNA methylase)
VGLVQTEDPRIRQVNTPSVSPAETLRTALNTALDGLAPRHTAQAVERLIAHYRGATPTTTPVLRDRTDVVAYAAYRMPATFEAMRAALAALVRALPAGWTPDSHADLGGGTGAAAWAVSATWGGERPVTVLDWAEPALALGRELATAHPSLRSADWQATRLGALAPPPAARAGGPGHPDRAPVLGPAGIVTLSYVLGELSERDRDAAVTAAAHAAGVVVIVEPGSPDGYARIMAARERLAGAGLRIAAPCPHSAGCPIEPGADWCHFSARVSRSSLHRQVKGGSLPYEDEKFSYVAAVRPSVAGVGPAAARVLRRPQLRKGHVLLDLCEADGSLTRTTVTKRHGTAYRAARDAAWGDSWDPGASSPRSPDTASPGDTPTAVRDAGAPASGASGAP